MVYGKPARDTTTTTTTYTEKTWDGICGYP
jgi:hypothetical protein